MSCYADRQGHTAYGKLSKLCGEVLHAGCCRVDSLT